MPTAAFFRLPPQAIGGGPGPIRADHRRAGDDRGRDPCCRACLAQRSQRKPTSGGRSMWRASTEPCHGSCARRRASPACCAVMAAHRRHRLSPADLRTASRRGSVPPILSRRNRCWMTWEIMASVQRKWLYRGACPRGGTLVPSAADLEAGSHMNRDVYI
jgi:hypothetical protein